MQLQQQNKIRPSSLLQKEVEFENDLLPSFLQTSVSQVQNE
jgi:hypothetical protein